MRAYKEQFADLIDEYKFTLQHCKDTEVSSTIQQEIRDVIKWIETGVDPQSTRSQTRTDAYTFDPFLMQQFIKYTSSYGNPEEYIESLEDLQCFDYEEEEKRLEDIKTTVNDAMLGLDSEEKAVYIAIKAEMLSYQRVANMMDTTRRNIQTVLERAERKIRKNIERGSQYELNL